MTCLKDVVAGPAVRGVPVVRGVRGVPVAHVARAVRVVHGVRVVRVDVDLAAAVVAAIIAVVGPTIARASAARINASEPMAKPCLVSRCGNRVITRLRPGPPNLSTRQMPERYPPSLAWGPMVSHGLHAGRARRLDPTRTAWDLMESRGTRSVVRSGLRSARWG